MNKVLNVFSPEYWSEWLAVDIAAPRDNDIDEAMTLTDELRNFLINGLFSILRLLRADNAIKQLLDVSMLCVYRDESSTNQQICLELLQAASNGEGFLENSDMSRWWTEGEICRVVNAHAR